MDTLPKRKQGAQLLVGRRDAMAMETALAIPAGKTRVFKGFLGPLVERYCVGAGYPKYHWSESKLQINETGQLDLSIKTRSGPPSLLTLTNETALRIINDDATLERVWEGLFKVYNQTLRKVGDTDFSVKHTRVKMPQNTRM